MKIDIRDRVVPLDWLRGLAALSIMFYHLYSWQVAHLDAGTFLGRLGIYSVSLFFVLSGLSMAIAYENLKPGLKSAGRFLVMRVFRIWPLLWIVTIYVSIQNHLFATTDGQIKVALNLSTLFGLFKPDQYIAVGAWSIGNEMVYYLATPILLWLYQKGRAAGNLAFAISVVVGLYFAWGLFEPNVELAKQWSTYVNPLNNFYFYVGGIAMFYNFRRIHLPQVRVFLLFLVAVVLLLFLPVKGNQIQLVTEGWRIAFSLACFLLVFSFYKWHTGQVGLLGRMFEYFGIATYGIYMIHPVIFRELTKAFSAHGFLMGTRMTIVLISGCTVMLTVILALLSYYGFERKMMRFLKRKLL
jgi:peptidoglycan/LPS O-acetylase OafA/YrhL